MVDLSGVAIDAGLGSYGQYFPGFLQALGCIQIRQQTITVGGAELLEFAYDWSNISPLVAGSSRVGSADYRTVPGAAGERLQQPVCHHGSTLIHFDR